MYNVRSVSFSAPPPPTLLKSSDHSIVGHPRPVRFPCQIRVDQSADVNNDLSPQTNRCSIFIDSMVNRRVCVFGRNVNTDHKQPAGETNKTPAAGIGWEMGDLSVVFNVRNHPSKRLVGKLRRFPIYSTCRTT